MSRTASPFIEKSTVAARMREAVTSSNLSAREIADQSRVKASHLSRFLRTGRGISPGGIERIAEVIGADLHKIYSSAQ